MNKKIFDLIFALISLVLLLSYGNAVVKAQEDQTQSSQSVFVPIVSNNPHDWHKITGRVVNQQNEPMAGVTIRTDKGKVWTSMSFDLSGYTGATIMLQWGTFNNGTGGITSMYVDDVILQVCP